LLLLAATLIVFAVLWHPDRYARTAGESKILGDESVARAEPKQVARPQSPTSSVSPAKQAGQPAPLSHAPQSAAIASPNEAIALPTPLVAEPLESIHADLEMMRTLIRDYRAVFGENPVGTNAEITHTLTGTNPRHVPFLSGGSPNVNSNGELVDRWGTPYFFHQVSGHDMEIRSAGPDRRMWNADDVEVR